MGAILPGNILPLLILLRIFMVEKKSSRLQGEIDLLQTNNTCSPVAVGQLVGVGHQNLEFR